MSGYGYEYEYWGNQPHESDHQQSSLAGSGLFTQVAAPSLASAEHPWTFEPVPGRPCALVSGDTKGIYRHLEETQGALSESADEVEDVESRGLEQLISGCTGRAVHGWSRNHWDNHKIVGRPRQANGEVGLVFTPVHLRYAVSRDRSVYAVKKAMVCDASERVAYPFALSNMIGMTCRRHDTTAGSLRHLVFYNVTNPQAWAAMVSAFHRAGVVLPEYSETGMARGMASTHSSRASWRRGSNAERSRNISRRQRAPLTSITVTETSHGDAWATLHHNNPFTKVADRIVHHEISTPASCLCISAYTLLAVPQERLFGPQEYWNALVAHLAPRAQERGGLQTDASYGSDYTQVYT